MVKALQDFNKIVETEVADQEEFKGGEEKQLASDSPLLRIDTTENNIMEETEALKQQINEIKLVPPQERICLQGFEISENYHYDYSPGLSSDSILLED